MIVRELELDLDAFEGPFDLLLTLVLKEELDLAEVDVAGIVVAFCERLAERGELDLEACGEFLVLVAALLELKARGLFPDEDAELSELEPEEAAEELARRLAEYRRAKEAAAWLAERLEEEGDRFFRLGPAPLAPRVERRLAPQEPESLAVALRLLAAEPPSVSLAHLELRFPPVSQFLDRFRAVLRRRRAIRPRRRGGRALAHRAGGCVSGAAGAPPLGRGLAGAGGAVRPDPRAARRGRRREESGMDRPLRLITASPVDRLALTLEALLVVASQPLSVEDLAVAADDDVGADRDGSAAAGGTVRRGPQRDRAGARGRRLGVSRVARGGRGVRAAVRAAGRARALGGGSRDAGDRRVPRAGEPPGDRAHARRGRRLGGCRVGGAGPDCRGRSRGGRRAGPCATGRRRSSSACSGSSRSRELPRLDDLGESTDEIRTRLESRTPRRGTPGSPVSPLLRTAAGSSVRSRQSLQCVMAFCRITSRRRSPAPAAIHRVPRAAQPHPDNGAACA